MVKIIMDQQDTNKMSSTGQPSQKSAQGNSSIHHLNLGVGELHTKVNISGEIALSPQAVMSTATLKRLGT